MFAHEYFYLYATKSTVCYMTSEWLVIWSSSDIR